MISTLRRIWRLFRLAAFGSRVWIGFLALGVILGLELLAVWLGVRLTYWSKDFWGALEAVDAPEALIQVGVFFLITAATATLYLIGRWIRGRLVMHWRERLTAKALDAWMTGGAYWHLRPGLTPEPVDNPDQRVAQDCYKFVDGFLRESMAVITNFVALFSYVALLWSLTDFALEFSLFGYAFSIAHYMVWVAFLYVAFSSVLTHYLGRALKPLLFRQERREADFRHGLIQLRDNATEVLQAGGESAERRGLDGYIRAIRGNWYRLLNREVILGLFTRPYMQSVFRLPLFFALPAYFAGSVQFGELMQISMAFSTVVTTLSWFIFSYKDLAELAAVSQRLDDLFENAANPKPVQDVPQEIVRVAGEGFATEGLQLFTPGGRALHPVPDFTARQGENIWISGASGQGKTLLLMTLSGHWRYGRGQVQAPEGVVSYLPQRPYVQASGLARAACYPMDPQEVGEARIEDLLALVGLGHLVVRLGQGGASVEGLSMGERQRLAMVRLLIVKPDWVLLDEVTSNLDLAAEAQLLALLQAELPETTFLMVSHREPVALKARRIWRVGQDIEEGKVI